MRLFRKEESLRGRDQKKWNKNSLLVFCAPQPLHHGNYYFHTNQVWLLFCSGIELLIYEGATTKTDNMHLMISMFIIIEQLTSRLSDWTGTWWVKYLFNSSTNLLNSFNVIFTKLVFENIATGGK